MTRFEFSMGGPKDMFRSGDVITFEDAEWTVIECEWKKDETLGADVFGDVFPGTWTVIIEMTDLKAMTSTES